MFELLLGGKLLKLLRHLSGWEERGRERGERGGGRGELRNLTQDKSYSCQLTLRHPQCVGDAVASKSHHSLQQTHTHRLKDIKSHVCKF